MPDKLPLFIAAYLTWIAGFVDAVGFLSLQQVYTANMSGNSIFVGVRAASQNWPDMFLHLWPVIVYVAGLFLCRTLIEFGAREHIRAIASFAFAFEMLVLAPACLLAAPHGAVTSYAYIACLALAMGVQNGALTHFSSLNLHTGFVTGTLLKAAEEFTKFFTWAFDKIRLPGNSAASVLQGARQQKPLKVALWLSFIWITYVVGAYCGAQGQHGFRMRSLVVPIACLALLILIDLYHPLAVPEEQEQTKRE